MDDLRLREGLMGVNGALWGLLEVKERSRLEEGRLRTGVRGECGMLGVFVGTAAKGSQSVVELCFC